MNRRELLKFFGAGTVIAPVVGGSLITSATAQLVRVPDVKPVELFSKIPEGLDLYKVRKATLSMEMDDGTVRTVGVNNLFPHGCIGPTDKFSVGIKFIRYDDASPSAIYKLGEIQGSGTLA